jgi:hypothetical protein
MVRAVAGVDDVERWATVTLRWLGHRPEPLVTERLWGCSLVLGDDDRDEHGWRHRVGFDRDGRPVILRHEPPPESVTTPDWEEIVSYEPGRVEVKHGAGRVTTTFDASGRAEHTVYVDHHGAQDTETYTYDDTGRLVGIEEARALDMTAQAGRGFGWPTGGPLTILHDERGMTKIATEDGAAVWARSDESWPALLERSLQAMYDEAAQIIADVHTWRDGASASGSALALGLCFTSGMGLGCTGRLVLDAPDAAADHVYRVLTGDALPSLDVGVLFELDFNDESRLVQQASAHQPLDPVRFLLSELAMRLATHDWSGVLLTAPEFAVFLDEHDAGAEPMWQSLVASNPPERVTQWTARWPHP